MRADRVLLRKSGIDKKTDTCRFSMVKMLLIALTVMIISIGRAMADDHTIKIASIQLAEGLNTNDGQGFYADILTSLVTIENYRPEIRIRPLKRSVVDFAKRKADCIWPVDRTLIVKLVGNDIDILESTYVFEATQHIFTAPGTAPITSMDEIAGRSIGLTIGSNVEQELRNADAQVALIPLQDNKVSMLVAGHLDAIVGWSPDFQITFQDLKLGSPQYSQSLILTKTRNAIVCHVSDITRSFIAQMDTTITTFRQSERFRTIAQKYGVAQALGLEESTN